MSLKNYYEITKPRMVYGNAIPVIGGYVLATRGAARFWPFVVMLAGISLVMASACVFNNYVDRDIDAKMLRTKNRAVVAGKISGRAALIYGTVLGLMGFAILVLHVNLVAAGVAAFGFFFYVCMYSMWWKRRSVWGTAVGSVGGAVPVVVGYVAVTGKIDLAAGILFATMVAWQMPHFFAIAIKYAEDYSAAGIPAVPLVRNMRQTKVQMLLYILAFTVFASLLTVFGYTNNGFLVVALILGLSWLGMCLKGFKIPDGDKAANIKWARDMFSLSLLVVTGLFVAMVVTATPW